MGSKAVKGDKPNAISFPTWSAATSDKGAGYGTLVSSPNMGKPGSGTCGLATASCASLSAYRVANAAPLAYTCSQVGSDVALAAGKTEPSVCGETTFAVETATGAIAATSWDGKEWPAPLQTTGDFIGAPVV